MNKVCLIVAAALMAGCSPHYQLVIAPSNEFGVYKIDTTTGQCWMLQNNSLWRPIRQP